MINVVQNEHGYFFIVGAQKAGTTSLFHYLRYHPEIYMPGAKEVSFFHRDNISADDWNKYKKEHLCPDKEVKLVGTSSPRYMCDESIPKKIFEHVPGARLIVILRDPIERVVSHFKMMVRWGVEKRTFDEVVREQLEEEYLQKARVYRYEDDVDDKSYDGFYITHSEYPRYLKKYMDYFDKENIFPLLSEDLKNNREESVRLAYDFLGVDSEFVPDNLSRDFHVGGTKNSFQWLRFIAGLKITRAIARTIFPKKIRSAASFRLLTANSSGGTMSVSRATYKALYDHYIDDAAWIESNFSIKPKWFSRINEKSDTLHI